MNKTKGDRIASIVGDAWAIHKDECSILCAMIDELTNCYFRIYNIRCGGV